MDGVFWSGNIGFVFDRRWAESKFTDARSIKRHDIGPELLVSGRLPRLGPAPVASWVVARLLHLTREHLGFETTARLHNDGGGIPLHFIAFTRSLKPLAFLFLKCHSFRVEVFGSCAADADPGQVVSAFKSALLSNPDELTACKLTTIDTDPPDLLKRRRSKPHVFGWDGKKFLGFRIEEEKFIPPAPEVDATDIASRSPMIEISDALIPSFNGVPINTAPSAKELHAILGTPNRLIEPKTRAPVGHRNGCLHVYDTVGLIFWQHHYTRRISSFAVVFSPDELVVLPDDPPPAAFPGTLRLDGFTLPASLVDFDQLIHNCPILQNPSPPFRCRIERNGFAINVGAKGYKLPRGERTRRERVTSIDLAWPHDNWGTPVQDE